MKNGIMEDPMERYAQQRDSEKARKKFVVFENTLRIINKLTAEESKTLSAAANYLANKLPRGVSVIADNEYYVKKNDDETKDQLFRLDDDGEVLLFSEENGLESIHDVGLASEDDYRNFITDIEEEFKKLKMVLPYDSTREALS